MVSLFYKIPSDFILDEKNRFPLRSNLRAALEHDLPAAIPTYRKSNNMNILIRSETPDDIEAIQQVTQEAFHGRPYSDETEPFIIERLRKAKTLTLSLVA